MKKLILFVVFNSTIVASYAQNLDAVGNINTKGKISINGNSGTVGQVLMSNGANPPAWTTVSNSTCAVGGKFSVRYDNTTAQTAGSQVDNTFSTALNAPASQSGIVDLLTLEYNTNSDVTIDLVNNQFVFNRAGMYHFEGLFRMFLTSSQVQSLGAGANINLKIDNSSIARLIEQMPVQSNGLVGGTLNNYAANLSFGFNRYFTAGQTLKFEVKLFALDTNPALTALGLASGAFISGYFVSE